MTGRPTLTLRPDPEGIAHAARLLAAGETVALPTETVYGLAADARNGQAVARIYAAKGRPSFNPLIVHLADAGAAHEIGAFDDEALRLARAFWPGPLTLVVPLRPGAGIPGIVTAGLETVGLRVPSHPIGHAVLAAFGGPLAIPSANRSGRISPTAAAHVLDPDTGLPGRIAAVVDGGACPVGVESTIVGWRDGAATLLRPGGVPAEAIEAALGHPLARGTDLSAPDAPGQLSSHYAPAASVRLGATDRQDGETLIGFGPVAGDLTLSASGDLTEAAARLFDILRAADRLGRPIAVALIPAEGLGLAINDRLARAAAPR
ncbi:L-threonylcarbamoyladenylate synthase [Paracoccus sp. (in: a-proteobacteria)]|uniref:L-threonylcarbamoyladenylate synthase n=1 Tax=Paracoccus sp. TaxID=267 RepID=UPI0026E0F029|nr:L-threonylcarbamoyladenylate synthase [Paracoccus sp. (in: a-proteobacteria)]MDO5370818.1 L-threonylcarbamoyladenylate synthase [Paracoccus sp. (in: a-proteobacteria)]